MIADSFHNIWLAFVEKVKNKFLLASIKSLTNSSGSLLQLSGSRL
jgi:hypothetical protein